MVLRRTLWRMVCRILSWFVGGIMQVDDLTVSLWRGSLTLLDVELSGETLSRRLGHDGMRVTRAFVKDLSVSLPWPLLFVGHAVVYLRHVCVDFVQDEKATWCSMEAEAGRLPVGENPRWRSLVDTISFYLFRRLQIRVEDVHITLCSTLSSPTLHFSLHSVRIAPGHAAKADWDGGLEYEECRICEMLCDRSGVASSTESFVECDVNAEETGDGTMGTSSPDRSCVFLPDHTFSSIIFTFMGLSVTLDMPLCTVGSDGAPHVLVETETAELALALNRFQPACVSLDLPSALSLYARDEDLVVLNWLLNPDSKSGGLGHSKRASPWSLFFQEESILESAEPRLDIRFSVASVSLLMVQHVVHPMVESETIAVFPRSLVRIIWSDVDIHAAKGPEVLVSHCRMRTLEVEDLWTEAPRAPQTVIAVDPNGALEASLRLTQVEEPCLDVTVRPLRLVLAVPLIRRLMIFLAPVMDDQIEFATSTSSILDSVTFNLQFEKPQVLLQDSPPHTHPQDVPTIVACADCVFVSNVAQCAKYGGVEHLDVQEQGAIFLRGRDATLSVFRCTNGESVVDLPSEAQVVHPVQLDVFLRLGGVNGNGNNEAGPQRVLFPSTPTRLVMNATTTDLRVSLSQEKLFAMLTIIERGVQELTRPEADWKSAILTALQHQNVPDLELQSRGNLPRLFSWRPAVPVQASPADSTRSRVSACLVCQKFSMIIQEKSFEPVAELLFDDTCFFIERTVEFLQVCLRTCEFRLIDRMSTTPIFPVFLASLTPPSAPPSAPPSGTMTPIRELASPSFAPLSPIPPLVDVLHDHLLKKNATPLPRNCPFPDRDRPNAALSCEYTIMAPSDPSSVPPLRASCTVGPVHLVFVKHVFEALANVLSTPIPCLTPDEEAALLSLSASQIRWQFLSLRLIEQERVRILRSSSLSPLSSPPIVLRFPSFEAWERRRRWLREVYIPHWLRWPQLSRYLQAVLSKLDIRLRGLRMTFPGSVELVQSPRLHIVIPKVKLRSQQRSGFQFGVLLFDLHMKNVEAFLVQPPVHGARRTEGTTSPPAAEDVTRREEDLVFRKESLVVQVQSRLNRIGLASERNSIRGVVDDARVYLSIRQLLGLSIIMRELASSTVLTARGGSTNALQQATERRGASVDPLTTVARISVQHSHVVLLESSARHRLTKLALKDLELCIALRLSGSSSTLLTLHTLELVDLLPSDPCGPAMSPLLRIGPSATVKVDFRPTGLLVDGQITDLQVHLHYDFFVRMAAISDAESAMVVEGMARIRRSQEIVQLRRVPRDDRRHHHHHHHHPSHESPDSRSRGTRAVTVSWNLGALAVVFPGPNFGPSVLVSSSSASCRCTTEGSSSSPTGSLSLTDLMVSVGNPAVDPPLWRQILDPVNLSARGMTETPRMNIEMGAVVGRVALSTIAELMSVGYALLDTISLCRSYAFCRIPQATPAESALSGSRTHVVPVDENLIQGSAIETLPTLPTIPAYMGLLQQELIYWTKHERIPFHERPPTRRGRRRRHSVADLRCASGVVDSGRQDASALRTPSSSVGVTLIIPRVFFSLIDSAGASAPQLSLAANFVEMSHDPAQSSIYFRVGEIHAEQIGQTGYETFLSSCCPVHPTSECKVCESYKEHKAPSGVWSPILGCRCPAASRSSVVRLSLSRGTDVVPCLTIHIGSVWYCMGPWIEWWPLWIRNIMEKVVTPEAMQPYSSEDVPRCDPMSPQTANITIHGETLEIADVRPLAVTNTILVHHACVSLSFPTGPWQQVTNIHCTADSVVMPSLKLVFPSPVCAGIHGLNITGSGRIVLSENDTDSLVKESTLLIALSQFLGALPDTMGSGHFDTTCNEVRLIAAEGFPLGQLVGPRLELDIASQSCPLQDLFSCVGTTFVSLVKGIPPVVIDAERGAWSVKCRATATGALYRARIASCKPLDPIEFVVLALDEFSVSMVVENVFVELQGRINALSVSLEPDGFHGHVWQKSQPARLVNVMGLEGTVGFRGEWMSVGTTADVRCLHARIRIPLDVTESLLNLLSLIRGEDRLKACPPVPRPMFRFGRTGYRPREGCITFSDSSRALFLKENVQSVSWFGSMKRKKERWMAWRYPHPKSVRRVQWATRSQGYRPDAAVLQYFSEERGMYVFHVLLEGNCRRDKVDEGVECTMFAREWRLVLVKNHHPYYAWPQWQLVTIEAVDGDEHEDTRWLSADTFSIIAKRQIAVEVALLDVSVDASYADCDTDMITALATRTSMVATSGNRVSSFHTEMDLSASCQDFLSARHLSILHPVHAFVTGTVNSTQSGRPLTLHATSARDSVVHVSVSPPLLSLLQGLSELSSTRHGLDSSSLFRVIIHNEVGVDLFLLRSTGKLLLLRKEQNTPFKWQSLKEGSGIGQRRMVLRYNELFHDSTDFSLDTSKEPITFRHRSLATRFVRIYRDVRTEGSMKHLYLWADWVVVNRTSLDIDILVESSPGTCVCLTVKGSKGDGTCSLKPFLYEFHECAPTFRVRISGTGSTGWYSRFVSFGQEDPILLTACNRDEMHSPDPYIVWCSVKRHVGVAGTPSPVSAIILEPPLIIRNRLAHSLHYLIDTTGRSTNLQGTLDPVFETSLLLDLSVCGALHLSLVGGGVSNTVVDFNKQSDDTPTAFHRLQVLGEDGAVTPGKISLMFRTHEEGMSHILEIYAAVLLTNATVTSLGIGHFIEEKSTFADAVLVAPGETVPYGGPTSWENVALAICHASIVVTSNDPSHILRRHDRTSVSGTFPLYNVTAHVLQSSTPGMDSLPKPWHRGWGPVQPPHASARLAVPDLGEIPRWLVHQEIVACVTRDVFEEPVAVVLHPRLCVTNETVWPLVLVQMIRDSKGTERFIPAHITLAVGESCSMSHWIVPQGIDSDTYPQFAVSLGSLGSLFSPPFSAVSSNDQIIRLRNSVTFDHVILRVQRVSGSLSTSTVCLSIGMDSPTPYSFENHTTRDVFLRVSRSHVRYLLRPGASLPFNPFNGDPSEHEAAGESIPHETSSSGEELEESEESTSGRWHDFLQRIRDRSLVAHFRLDRHVQWSVGVPVNRPRVVPLNLTDSCEYRLIISETGGRRVVSLHVATPVLMTPHTLPEEKEEVDEGGQEDENENENENENEEEGAEMDEEVRQEGRPRLPSSVGSSFMDPDSILSSRSSVLSSRSLTSSHGSVEGTSSTVGDGIEAADIKEECECLIVELPVVLFSLDIEGHVFTEFHMRCVRFAHDTKTKLAEHRVSIREIQVWNLIEGAEHTVLMGHGPVNGGSENPAIELSLLATVPLRRVRNIWVSVHPVVQLQLDGATLAVLQARMSEFASLAMTFRAFNANKSSLAVERTEVAPVRLQLSLYNLLPLHPVDQLMSVRGEKIHFDRLVLDRQPLSFDAVARSIREHFERGVSHALLRLVGSIDILGNPSGLVRGVREGFDRFVDSASRGMTSDGLGDAVGGVHRGTSALFASVSKALASSASGIGAASARYLGRASSWGLLPRPMSVALDAGSRVVQRLHTVFAPENSAFPGPVPLPISPQMEVYPGIPPFIQRIACTEYPLFHTKLAELSIPSTVRFLWTPASLIVISDSILFVEGETVRLHIPIARVNALDAAVSPSWGLVIHVSPLSGSLIDPVIEEVKGLTSPPRISDLALHATFGDQWERLLFVGIVRMHMWEWHGRILPVTGDPWGS